MVTLAPEVRQAVGETGLTDDQLIAAVLGGELRAPAFVYRAGMDIAAMGGTATRASVALYRDINGIWQSAAVDTPRNWHYHYDGTKNVVTLLREGAGTNSALGSCSFGDGTYWDNAAPHTLAAATSCIAGQTATKNTNISVAAASRSQTIGTFVNAQTDCVSVILENVDATTTRIGIRDATAAAYVHSVDLTWATLATATVTGSGTSGAIDLGTGPNGGRLVRFWLTATGTAAGTGAAGNSRQVRMFPTGIGADTLATILHHAQFEAATSYPSSPIVTVAGAVTRAADLISTPWTRNPEAGTLYVDAYDLTTGTSKYLLTLANSGGAVPRFFLYRNTTPYRALVEMAAGTSISNSAASPAFGDRTESRIIHAVSGGNITAALGLAINGGAEAVAAAGTARALDAAWSAPTRLYIGAREDGSLPANLAIRSILYVPGNEASQSLMRQLAGT